MSLILNFLLINFVLLIFVRFLKLKREKILFLCQVMLFLLTNLYIYTNMSKTLKIIELLILSLITFSLSIVVLEVWALSNDGYTTLILLLIYHKKLSASNMAQIDEIIQKEKYFDRRLSLKKLKLVNQECNQLTTYGAVTISIINIFRLLLLIRKP